MAKVLKVLQPIKIKDGLGLESTHYSHNIEIAKKSHILHFHLFSLPLPIESEIYEVEDNVKVCTDPNCYPPEVQWHRDNSFPYMWSDNFGIDLGDLEEKGE